MRGSSDLQPVDLIVAVVAEVEQGESAALQGLGHRAACSGGAVVGCGLVHPLFQAKFG